MLLQTSILLAYFLPLTSALPSNTHSIQPRADDPKVRPPYVGLTVYTDTNRRGIHFTTITDNNTCHAIEPGFARTMMTVSKSLRAAMYSKCDEKGTCEEANPPIRKNELGPIVQCWLYNTKDCSYKFSGNGQLNPDRCLIEHTGPMIDIEGAEQKDDGTDLSTCLRGAKRPGCNKQEELCGMEQIESW